MYGMCVLQRADKSYVGNKQLAFQCIYILKLLLCTIVRDFACVLAIRYMFRKPKSSQMNLCYHNLKNVTMYFCRLWYMTDSVPRADHASHQPVVVHSRTYMPDRRETFDDFVARINENISQKALQGWFYAELRTD